MEKQTERIVKKINHTGILLRMLTLTQFFMLYECEWRLQAIIEVLMASIYSHINLKINYLTYRCQAKP